MTLVGSASSQENSHTCASVSLSSPPAPPPLSAADVDHIGVGSPPRSSSNITPSMQLPIITSVCSTSNLKSSAHQFSYAEIFEFLKRGEYPLRIKQNRVKEAKFRLTCKSYRIVQSKLYHAARQPADCVDIDVDDSSKRLRLVVWTEEEQRRIIKRCHLGNTKAAAASRMEDDNAGLRHLGSDATLHAISQKYYWREIAEDVQRYVTQQCDKCGAGTSELGGVEMEPTNSKEATSKGKEEKEKEEKKEKKEKGEENKGEQRAMSRVEVRITELEKSAKCYLIVLIDYQTKWVEAKFVRPERAGRVGKARGERVGALSHSAVASFIFELICRHGCFDTIVLHHHRRDGGGKNEATKPEFVNAVAQCLQEMTGAPQNISSGQSNDEEEAEEDDENDDVSKCHANIHGCIVNYVKEQRAAASDGEGGMTSSSAGFVLDSILLAMRTCTHKCTGRSAYEMLHGRTPPACIELSLEVDGHVNECFQCDSSSYLHVSSSSVAAAASSKQCPALSSTKPKPPNQLEFDDAI